MTRIIPQTHIGAIETSSAQSTNETQASRPRSIDEIVDKHLPDLFPYEDVYRHIHANPCLSFVENETAQLVCKRLSQYKSPAFDIRTNIGVTGLVAILRNGDGPTVLLRADMDALPVKEETGLPYASKKEMRDEHGNVQPVMHACGHDMHVTSLLAAAHLLHNARDEWSGTLLCCFQQAEEAGGGAQNMIDDGMYDPKRHNVPVPDVILGGHVFPLPAGSITTRRGTMMAASDSLAITFHGRGGHASQPESTCDPVVMAASAVMRLQTVVSREVGPFDPAVLSIASFHAGSTAANVIPDTARITTNVRSYSPEVRKQIDTAIRRIVRGEADSSGAPKPPGVESMGHFPVTENDERVTAKVQAAFAKRFGGGYHDLERPVAGSEDFGTLGTAVGRPTCFWMYGGHDPDHYEWLRRRGRLAEIPSNHSSKFAPVLMPTLQVAVEALSLAALTWLASGSDKGKNDNRDSLVGGRVRDEWA